MVILICGGFIHIYRNGNVKKFIKILSVAYSLLVLCLSILNLLLLLIGTCLPPSPINDVSSVNKLVVVILVFGYFYAISILFYTFFQSFKRKGYHEVIRKIKTLPGNIDATHKLTLLIFGVIYIVISILIGFVMSVSVKIQMNNLSPHIEYFHSYLPADESSYGYFIAFLSLFHGVFVNLVIITSALFLVETVIILLSNQFKILTQKIKKLDATNIEKIDNIIFEYETLCDLVKEADKTFIVVIGVMVTTEIIYACIMGYLLVISDFNMFSLQNFGTLLFGEVSQLFIMCGSAAYLNMCTHEFCDALYKKVCSFEKSYTKQKRILMFLMNALHSPVGLTYFGLFTLSKEAFLSIFGTLLAYFIIVIQFAQQASYDDISLFRQGSTSNYTKLTTTSPVPEA